MTAFCFNHISTQAVATKLDTYPMEKVFNSHLKLSDYGSGIERIFFSFLAVPSDNKRHRQRLGYDADSRSLEVVLPLSYAHVQSHASEDVQTMMAALFLTSLSLYPRLDIPDFDWDRFSGDVEHLLQQRGWLPSKAS